MNERGIEVKVGILVTVCLALLVAFVVALGDFTTGDHGEVFVDVETSADLKVGSPVKIAGVGAGKVREITYHGGEMDKELGRRVWVRVKLGVDAAKIPTIHDDARFYITTQGVLGEKYVEIDPGTPEKPSLASGAVRLGEPPLRLEIMAAHASGLLESMSRVVRENEGTFGDIIKETRETVTSIKEASQRVEKMVRDNETKVNEIIAELLALERDARQLMAAANNALGDGEELKQTVQNVNRISGEVRGKVGPVVADLRSTLGKYAQLAESGETAVESARSEFVAAISDARKALADVGTITGRIESGEGSLGALLSDEEMYDDVREMLKDLKRHPWKFIWKE